MIENEFLIKMNDPEAVYAEVHSIVTAIFKTFDFKPLRKVFDDVQNLYNGHYPGYKECNTEYHDFRHVTDTFLLTARLIHGAHLNGIKLTKRNIFLGLVSALLHDTGYIQMTDDRAGTGAKYTASHVDRSIEFTEKYLLFNGYSAMDYELCHDFIKCTDFVIDAKSIDFISEDVKIMGMIVGTADIVGQMADRRYLEKLNLLYYEFKEADIGDYTSEFDMLEKTVGFFDFVSMRIMSGFENVNRFLVSHYQQRWGVDKDVYREDMNKNVVYLKKIVTQNKKDYRSMLNRRLSQNNIKSRQCSDDYDHLPSL